MDINEQLMNEWEYLASHSTTAITISNTAKPNGATFSVLPRRFGNETAIASFLVNSVPFLEETVRYFDGKVDTIYVDVESKQELDLFSIAKSMIKKSKLAAIKPNDMTLEACDLLLRNHFEDDLDGKDIAVIGTGNLASKIALRTAERRANVFIDGLTKEKELTIINGVNSFLPAFSPQIKTMNQWKGSTFDVIISFLSGPYWQEEELLSHIDENTFIIDGGINNFSALFIKKMLEQETMITRLDVRLGISYQLIGSTKDTNFFFNDVYGEAKIKNISIVSGGYIGGAGSVIVNQIVKPTQVIGIANGMGGVKELNAYTDEDKRAIKMVQQSIQNRK